MRAGNAQPARHQQPEAAGHCRDGMADHEHQKQDHQQPLALGRTYRQHQGQGADGYHPRIDGQHQPHVLGAHGKALADHRQQSHRRKLGGVEDESGQSQSDDGRPAGGGCIGCARVVCCARVVREVSVARGARVVRDARVSAVDACGVALGRRGREGGCCGGVAHGASGYRRQAARRWLPFRQVCAEPGAAYRAMRSKGVG